jgi:hypothetical protein
MEDPSSTTQDDVKSKFAAVAASPRPHLVPVQVRHGRGEVEVLEPDEFVTAGVDHVVGEVQQGVDVVEGGRDGPPKLRIDDAGENLVHPERKMASQVRLVDDVPVQIERRPVRKLHTDLPSHPISDQGPVAVYAGRTQPFEYVQAVAEPMSVHYQIEIHIEAHVRPGPQSFRERRPLDDSPRELCAAECLAGTSQVGKRAHVPGKLVPVAALKSPVQLLWHIRPTS